VPEVLTLINLLIDIHAAMTIANDSPLKISQRHLAAASMSVEQAAHIRIREETFTQIKLFYHIMMQIHANRLAPCSLGLSATSQQYFSLRTNQPPVTS
jgi:hypothetical protein